MMAMTSAALVPRLSDGTLPPNGPVPRLTQRVIELLRVEKEDVVVDFQGRDLQSLQSLPEGTRPRFQRLPLSPFSERLVFLLSISGVRVVQMSRLTFGRFPMRYRQVLLREGFSQLGGSLRPLLSAVQSRLDPAGRLLVVDSAPSTDAPLFAEGLRCWKRQHRSPEEIAELMSEVGFSAQVETVECVSRVSAAECFRWVESRNWPILESFADADLQLGLCELRARYGSQRMVEFTSRFDLVLGTKPEAVAS
jgi:hypothetical protein